MLKEVIGKIKDKQSVWDEFVQCEKSVNIVKIYKKQNLMTRAVHAPPGIQHD